MVIQMREYNPTKIKIRPSANPEAHKLYMQAYYLLKIKPKLKKGSE